MSRFTHSCCIIAEIGKDKIREALATGAKTIVSAYPSCKTSINDAIIATGADQLKEN